MMSPRRRVVGRWIKAATLYLVAFLPLHALVAVVEVSIRGGDPLTQNFLYDLSAWSVFYGLPLAVCGFTAVPLLVFSARLARNWVSGHRLMLLVAGMTPVLFADLTVFDPETVSDRAAFTDPHRYSVGIVHVVVNGVPVIEDASLTGEKPGRVIRGPARPAGR